MSNGSRTNFCYLSNDSICILKPVDRKIILPRVITLPHCPLRSELFLKSESVDTIPCYCLCEVIRHLNCKTSALILIVRNKK